jgi:hypothetical protein
VKKVIGSSASRRSVLLAGNALQPLKDSCPNDMPFTCNVSCHYKEFFTIFLLTLYMLLAHSPVIKLGNNTIVGSNGYQRKTCNFVSLFVSWQSNNPVTYLFCTLQYTSYIIGYCVVDTSKVHANIIHGDTSE